MYRLAIFDLDGTLLDTIGDLAAAGNHTLREMGYPEHTIDEYKLFVGNGIPKLVQRMLPENHTGEEEQRALGIFSEYYAAHKSDHTVPYKGMPELLEELRRSGIHCAVNTNKAHDFSEELVRAAFGGSIEGLIGYGAGYPAKPSPEAALELCARFGAEKSEAIYIGDSNVDMATAAAAGLDSCAVLWGFRSREELSQCNPTHMAETVGQLREILIG